MRKLELKDIIGYLPYDLQYWIPEIKSNGVLSFDNIRGILADVLSVNTGLTGVSKVIAAAFYEEESFGVQGWWTMVPCRKNASNDNFEANIGSSLATGTYQIVFLYI